MPFYEYQCSSCHAHVEVLQKLSDAPLRKCPNCGKQQLKRLISAPVFRLKGGGWYETDFKSDKEGKRNLAEHPDKEAKESTPADATAKAPDTKTDVKADTKQAPKPAEAKPPAEAKSRSAKISKAAKPNARPVAATKRKAGKR